MISKGDTSVRSISSREDLFSRIWTEWPEASQTAMPDRWWPRWISVGGTAGVRDSVTRDLSRAVTRVHWRWGEWWGYVFNCFVGNLLMGILLRPGNKAKRSHASPLNQVVSPWNSTSSNCIWIAISHLTSQYQMSVHDTIFQAVRMGLSCSWKQMFAVGSTSFMSGLAELIGLDQGLQNFLSTPYLGGLQV